MLLLLDDEKAYDQVSWTFIGAVLKNIVLGPVMLHRILALYYQPYAQI